MYANRKCVRSFARVKPRHGVSGYEILDDTMIRLNIASRFLRPFVIPHAAEQSRFSISSTFRGKF